MQSSVAHALLGRGVWMAPYLTANDEAVLIAIDRRGAVRKYVKLRHGVDEQRATDWLWSVLDRIDPPLTLRLVKTAPERAPRPPREIDPRLYEDPRSPLAKKRYLRSLVRNAAARLPFPHG
jgi:hypothetical protein